MKLDTQEKQARKSLKQMLKAYNGIIMSDSVTGTTVAAMPCVPWHQASSSGREKPVRYCKIATAFCNFDTDTWNRKRGEFIALQRLLDMDQFVAIPTLDRTLDEVVLAFMRDVC